MIKILVINAYPIASKCAIGYMSEHIWNNKELFNIMELYTNDVEVYKNVSERYFCKINPIIVREIQKQEKAITTVPSNDARKSKEIVTTICKMFLPIRVCKTLWERICTFSPDFIYTQGYDIRILRVASKIAKKTGKKLIVHTLDDWFTTEKRVEDYMKRRVLSKCIENGISFVGSPSMSNRIMKLCDKDSFFLSNCAVFVAKNENDQRSGTDVIYVGNLTPKRYESLNEIAQQIEKKNVDLRIHVYAPEDQIVAYRGMMKESIVLHTAVPQEQVRNLIANARVMLHVEPFDMECRSFIKYSLSTKIAEYASIGKPIVYYGPMDVGTAIFLNETGIGKVFNSANDALKQIICLLEDEIEYEKDSLKTIEAGREFFDTKVVQERMYEFMRRQLE